MAKVFIINDGGHDYSDAQRFGEIVFCSKGVLKKDDAAMMYRELRSCFEEHATAGDYILVSGLNTMCMVAAALFADMFGELHLLIFHGGQYVARDLVLPSKQPGGTFNE